MLSCSQWGWMNYELNHKPVCLSSVLDSIFKEILWDRGLNSLMNVSAKVTSWIHALTTFCLAQWVSFLYTPLQRERERIMSHTVPNNNIFVLQRMDLGECIKVHDLALRADYEIASKEHEYFFELDVSCVHTHTGTWEHVQSQHLSSSKFKHTTGFVLKIKLGFRKSEFLYLVEYRGVFKLQCHC